MRKNIAVLGGDTRQSALTEYLLQMGHTVKSYGVSSPCAVSRWQDAVQGADCVVLPLPISTNGRHLHQSFLQGQEPLELDMLFKQIPENAIVFGGKCQDAVRKNAEALGVKIMDYNLNEAFQQKNAYLTAEGALSILMREIPRAVKELPIAVIGYGRIAKYLSKMLVAMRADLTVVARRQEAVLAASAIGAKTVLMREPHDLQEALRGKLAIVNTVPVRLVDEDVLKAVRRDALILDLASAPGGIDGIAAETLGIRVIWALSLPGKYAPLCAGEIIGETLLEMLREGVKL